MMRTQTGIITLICLAVVGFLVYLLSTEIVKSDVPVRPMEAQPYNAPVAEENTQKHLNIKTDILGHAVYDSNQNVLGRLYDIYANPENGEIQWLSINISNMTTDRPDAELILVPYMRVQSMDDDMPVILSMAKAEFFELPFQQQDEKKLEGMVSLRSLPSSKIVDSKGIDIGYVDKVTYENGRLKDVHFYASDNYLSASQGAKFSLPFMFLKHSVVGEIESEIQLTERQEGAIDMYFKNEDAPE